MLSSSVLLGESLSGWKIQAAILVLSWLALGLFGGRVLLISLRKKKAL